MILPAIHLKKGPNYINDIPNVLAAWRWDDITYSSDQDLIEHFSDIHPDDQVFHRFVWRDKPTDEPTIYQWLRLSFGDKLASDIASNSIKVLAKTAEQEQPQAAAELLQHIYIDDVAGSRPTVQQVKEVTTGIDFILENGKFEIKTWHSKAKKSTSRMVKISLTYSAINGTKKRTSLLSREANFLNCANN